MNKIIIRLVISIVAFMFVAILFAAGFRIVNDGYMGVQISTVGKERVLSETLKQGWYWRRPLMVEIVNYSITEQHFGENLENTSTQDKKRVSISVDLYYQLQQDKLVQLHKQYGSKNEIDNKLENLLKSSLQKITAKYTREALFSESQETLVKEIENSVSTSFGEGIKINNVVLKNLRFPDQYTNELNQFYPDKSTALQLKKTCKTRDKKSIVLKLQVYYRINEKDAESVHNTLGKGYVQQYLLPLAESTLDSVCTSYTLDEIYMEKTRRDIVKDFHQKLSNETQENKIQVDNAIVSDVLFEDQYQAVLDQIQKTEMELKLLEQKAILEAKQAENADKARERERMNKKLDAEAAQNAEIIKAEGVKKAEILRAEGKAEALLKVQKIIAENPEILKYLYVDKISENVKVIVVPSNNGNLQINDLMEKIEK